MTDLSAKVPIENLIDFDNDSDGELSEELLTVNDMNALPDDEDAIDRLLMGDAFDTAEESGQAVGIKEKLVEDITLPEFEEFAGFDDEFDDFEQTKPVQYDAKTEMSKGINPSARFESEPAEAAGVILPDDNLAEIDDLDEITDDFGEQALPDPTSVTETAEAEQTPMQAAQLPDELEDDFLLANFDITADFEPDLPQEHLAEAVADDTFEQAEQAPVIPYESNHMDTAGKITPDPLLGLEPDAVSADMQGMNQFKLDQELINRQQKKLMQELDNKTRKATIFMSVALALASVALIAAISVGILAFGARTQAAKATESVTTLAQDVKAITPTTSGNDLVNVNLAVEQLNQKVDGLAGQLDELGKSSATVSKNKLTDVGSKQNVVNKTIAALQHKIDVLEKQKTTEASVKPEPQKPEPQKVEPAKKPATAKAATVRKNTKSAATAPTDDWSVNLLAMRESGFANSKAAEFAKKGVPVEVVQVAVNDQTWYRLRVSGFNNQNEATAYAERAKKALKLNSVWVRKTN
jgi:hypothetical protein